jgi:NDP-sugar pyrophosphorylase family protein
MKIIIPMAGTGDRFIKAGYNEPKPLIKVNGKRIIEYILDIFSNNDEYIFICNKLHIETTDIKNILLKLKPNATIIEIPNHKKGPVHTVNYCLDLIKDDEEVIVSYCDNPFLYDKDDFNNFLKINKPDGCIFSHSGFHPHSLNSTKMAFIQHSGDNVKAIKEKECYTENHLNEHASTGTYYFKHGSYIKKYFMDMVDKNIHYNGEYYVTLVYNLLIEDGLKVMYYDTPYVTVFGTPEEVQTFEAWKVILSSGQISHENDLSISYRYWKTYHEQLCK